MKGVSGELGVEQQDGASLQGPGESVFLVEPIIRLKLSRGNRLGGHRSPRKSHVAGVYRGDTKVVGDEIRQVGGSRDCRSWWRAGFSSQCYGKPLGCLLVL